MQGCLQHCAVDACGSGSGGWHQAQRMGTHPGCRHNRARTCPEGHGLVVGAEVNLRGRGRGCRQLLSRQLPAKICAARSRQIPIGACTLALAARLPHCKLSRTASF